MSNGWQAAHSSQQRHKCLANVGGEVKKSVGLAGRDKTAQKVEVKEERKRDESGEFKKPGTFWSRSEMDCE